MFKIIYRTIGLLIVTATVVLFLGLVKGPKIEAELVVYLPYSQDYVYAIYTDIRSYPDRKKHLQGIEILETDPAHILKWRENYNEKSFLEYEIIEQSKPVVFDYQINHNNRYSSLVTTTFREVGEFTEIVFTEEGTIDHVFLRGLRFIVGDKRYLKSEAKWIRVAILNEQIARR